MDKILLGNNITLSTISSFFPSPHVERWYRDELKISQRWGRGKVVFFQNLLQKYRINQKAQKKLIK